MNTEYKIILMYYKYNMSITEIVLILDHELQLINTEKLTPENLVIGILHTELNQVDQINKEFYYQTAY
jgi:hypothetical protein